MTASFFVKINVSSLSIEQREVFTSLVLRVAAPFSFQGMEDWSVDLSAKTKVLGAEQEFHDLRQSGSMNPEIRVHFGKKADGARFGRLLKGAFSDLKVSAPRALAKKDWMKEWRKHYRTQLVSDGGQKIAIVPAWLKAPKNILSVRIQPGQAFGTGTHPTTRLCLRLLMREERKKVSALDFGAGTGILSFALAKLQPGSKVVAVESDRVALEQCRKNARLNRLTLTFRRTMPKGKFDVVLANVLAPVLLDFRGSLQAAVKDGGILVLSGLLAKEADSFLAQFNAREFFLEKRLEEGDWCALLLRRR